MLPGVAKPFCNLALTLSNSFLDVVCVCDMCEYIASLRLGVVKYKRIQSFCFAASRDDPMKSGVFLGFPMKSVKVF